MSRRLLCTALALCPPLGYAVLPPAAPAEEVVYVVNGYCHDTPQPEWSTVMMLRGSDLEILRTLELPAKDAHSIAATPDGSQLWVTCSNGYRTFVVDAESFEVVHEYDYAPAGIRPMGVAVEPDGLEAFIGLRDSFTCMRYDTATYELLTPDTSTGIEPAFMLFTPDGTRVCVSDMYTTVRVFRTADLVPQRTYTFDTAAMGLGEAAVSPDGNVLYVCNMGRNRIERVMLTLPWMPLPPLSTMPYIKPRGIAISPDGNYLFIGHYMGTDSKVTMWSLASWTLCAMADIPINGRRVVANDDCNRIYVTEHTDDKCCAYRVDTAGESMFIDAIADLNAIPGHKASPIGIVVGDWEPPPIDLTADKTTFATTDRISVTADVLAIPTPCYPFVRILLADGSTLYYESGRGFTNSPTPYLGFAAGTVMTTALIPNYPALTADFSGIIPGTYVLEGGAVDATKTTSASNLIYFGRVDRETLTVR
ncbi:MAG: YncE family protein [Chlamydiota bacterium]